MMEQQRFILQHIMDMQMWRDCYWRRAPILRPREAMMEQQRLMVQHIRGHADVVRLLLEKGANIEATRSDSGPTALHSAVITLQTEVVRLLLEEGANIHSATTQADTALHLVFHVSITDHWRKFRDPKQLVPTITLLLAHGSNILQKNNLGQTPLDLAENGGYSEAKYLFLRYIKERNLQEPEA
ncbi:ankyrin [Terfezia boudieri ATCC MYA-4762]|uniref:Ankyrin n=1 Tax=Terfezia boudieri ATCC MYA-4762 TaxID=1051890 RepID=A0A3N4LKS1_9PEZI|nr:ankyrin [Terfezia boudieri ATCC MYA-4762]